MLTKRQINKMMKLILKYHRDDEKYIDPNVLLKHYKGNKEYIHSCLCKMDAFGYISYKKHEDQIRPFIVVLPIGKCYFENLSNERAKNYTIPILVTVITTIILKLLEKILPLAQEIFSHVYDRFFPK